MSPQETFALAREYGIIKPGLVIAFPQLSRMVADHEEARAAIEAEMDAAWEERQRQAWSNVYERNDRAREEDERELAHEAWLYGR